MSIQRSLCDLGIGDSAVVAAVSSPEKAMERRLRDLGLIPGTVVTCTAKSPAGDPCAYLIRGAVIAIRRRDALGVTLQQTEEAVFCSQIKQEAPAF